MSNRRMANAGSTLSHGHCHGIPSAIGNHRKGQSEICGPRLRCSYKTAKLGRPENVVVYLQGIRAEKHLVMQVLCASSPCLGERKPGQFEVVLRERGREPLPSSQHGLRHFTLFQHRRIEMPRRGILLALRHCRLEIDDTKISPQHQDLRHGPCQKRLLSRIQAVPEPFQYPPIRQAKVSAPLSRNPDRAESGPMSNDLVRVRVEADPGSDGKSVFRLTIRIPLLLHGFQAGGVQQRYAMSGCFQQKQVRKARWLFVTKRHIDPELARTQLRDEFIIEWITHERINDCGSPTRLARTVQSFANIPYQRFKRAIIHFR